MDAFLFSVAYILLRGLREPVNPQVPQQTSTTDAVANDDDDAQIIMTGVFWCPAILSLEISNPAPNVTNSTNDMYVIHATVYQVGIITNKSDEEIANMTGNQEALTFYHSNGSNVDLSGIPAPLMTNVSAQSAVAVAPVRLGSAADTNPPLAVLSQLTSRKRNTVKRSENSVQSRYEGVGADDHSDLTYLFKRSAGNSSSAGPTIKVVKETSLIPPEVGLKSIGLPDLVGLKTSLTSVPVPIPNTSVVHYAKVNTLVKAP